jgi:hypothetical protein
MIKGILNKINPIRWFEAPIKRQLVSYAIKIAKNWVRGRIHYHPLQNYIIRLLRRIEDLAPRLISGEDRRDLFKDYWQSDKVGIINDQTAMLAAIAEAEISDKELANIVKETIAKLEAWKAKRLEK